MSEPFPSKAYLDLCTRPEVAEKLREEWRKRGPQEGDWFYSPNHGKALLLTQYNVWFVGAPKRFVQENAPLFTLCQLIGMLEERGYSIILDTCERDVVLVGIYIMGGMSCEALATGPDPATALLRAWLEVVKDE